MLVVRKLDHELPLVLRLHPLVRIVRITKGKAPALAWRGAYVTDSADCRTSADDRLTGEKLLPVTAHARVVIGKVCHVGKFSFRSPRGRDFVTITAGERFVFV